MKKIYSRVFSILFVFTLILSMPVFMAQANAATVSSTAGVVNTVSGSLNVRQSASADSTALASLPKGSYVTLLSQSGSWWRVEYVSGAYGYVSAGFIASVSGSYAAAVNIASGSLNVRSGAGTSYPIQSQLPAGKTVVVLSTSAGWSRILYNGTKVGYVSAQYLSAAQSTKMLWPVPASAKINQYFSGTHLGIDIGSSVYKTAGDAIVASYGGTVVYSGQLTGYGTVVYINSYYNGQYIQTRYAHLLSTSVSAGETVGAGQKIGAMGNSGESTGAHLHFEVRIRSSSDVCLANAASTAVNPLNYVSNQ